MMYTILLVSIKTILGVKIRFQLMSGQSLPEGWGAVSLSALWRDYWGCGGTGKRLSNSIQYVPEINYTLSASQTYDERIIMKINV